MNLFKKKDVHYSNDELYKLKKFDYLKKYYNLNRELGVLLTLVKEDPILYKNNCRLLSYIEIKNYKEKLQINDDLVPIIDISDNDFVVFDYNTESFGLYNIVDECLFKKLTTINNYINDIMNYNGN